MTLTNGNGVSFPESRVAVVAGAPRRETQERAIHPDEPEDNPGDHEEEIVLARCWPMSTTGRMEWNFFPEIPPPDVTIDLPSSAPVGTLVTVTGMRIMRREQLGDLKLYRVPEPTTLNARQQRQVRLLDREGIPVEQVYFADVGPDTQDDEPVEARWSLRTRNDKAHHLGVPLPMGDLMLTTREGLLLSSDQVEDLAAGEPWEIQGASAPDVQVRVVTESRVREPDGASELPLLPGLVHLPHAVLDEGRRVEITNARRTPLTFEARLPLDGDSQQLIAASRAPAVHGSYTVLRIPVPARRTVVIRYRTEHRVPGSAGGHHAGAGGDAYAHGPASRRVTWTPGRLRSDKME